MAHVVVNLERASSWQAQTDTFLGSYNVTVCGNDYTATNLNLVRNLFAPPTSSNPSPRPIFAVINCVSNSPTHAYRQILVNEVYAGGGAQDFSSSIANWRRAIDSVQPPPPRIGTSRINGDRFEFSVPGQRGRTNQVEVSSDLLQWTVVTNLFGSNGPIPVSEPHSLEAHERYYRVTQP